MQPKKDLENKKELARILYLGGESQVTISERVGVSKVTVTRWVQDGGWKEMRAAKNITRPELINKALLTINKILDSINESDDPSVIANVGDKLSKLASFIEKLDKKANVVDVIEVFTAFNKWIQLRMQTDPELTPELVKAINKYQDQFVVVQLNQKMG